MSLRCSHCKKKYKPTEIKKVALRNSINRRSVTWFAPKRICVHCLRKEPLAGNYRIAGLTADKAEALEGKRRRETPKELTEKQKVILEFIIDSIEANHRTPTIREICQHFVLASGSIKVSIRGLVKKGHLLQDEFTARGIRLNPAKFEVKVLKVPNK